MEVESPACTKVSDNGHYAKGRAPLVGAVMSALVMKCRKSNPASPPVAAGSRAGPDLMNSELCPDLESNLTVGLTSNDNLFGDKLDTKVMNVRIRQRVKEKLTRAENLVNDSMFQRSCHV